MALKGGYRHYNLLMEISFWISMVYLVRLIGRLTGLLATSLPGPLGKAVGLVVLANLVLAIFLVLARFMRDEYAERIWQAAAQRFVYCLIAVPFALSILAALFEDAIRQSVSNSWVAPDLLEEFQRHPDPVWHFYGGVGHAVMIFGLLAPAVFVCLYKWCLWRDGR
jgi:hypothetical protein